MSIDRVFFFKQKTAYEMRISDWSSDVCSSDLVLAFRDALPGGGRLMGLDVGTKTIGVALCDAGWTIATAAELMKRGKFSADLERLKVTVAGDRKSVA